MSDVIDVNQKPTDLYEAGLIIGALKSKLEQLQKNMLILHIRSRIEELEKRFLKPYMLSWTRYDKWNKILRGATRDLKMKNELLRFRNSITVDIEELINTIVNLYGEFSDCAAHNIHYPIRYDDASIIELLEKFHITPDQSKVDAVKVILKPIP